MIVGRGRMKISFIQLKQSQVRVSFSSIYIVSAVFVQFAASLVLYIERKRIADVELAHKLGWCYN